MMAAPPVAAGWAYNHDGKVASAGRTARTKETLMAQSHTRQIYVALLSRKGERWRCVDAVSEGGDAYRIISENRDPDEQWEYTTGEVVRCRATTLRTGERILAATQRLNRP